MNDTSRPRGPRVPNPAPARMWIGAGAVLLGGLGGGLGALQGDLDLRTGIVPWALGTLAIGVAWILLGSYRGGIGRPRSLVRLGTLLALVGLGVASAFFFGMGLLAAAGSDVLDGEATLVMAIGTLVASVATLLLLPIGLIAVSVAVLLDDEVSRTARPLPLLGALGLLAGPLLVGVLPEAAERPVLVGWPIVLGATWATYALTAAPRVTRLLTTGQANNGDDSLAAT